MMLKKRLQSVELAQAKRNGDLNYKVVVRMDGESDDEAQVGSGIDSKLSVIFISKMGARL